jgi:hypothetical protein
VLLVPKLISYFGLGRTFALLRELAGGVLKPVPALASERFFTPVPIQLGRYAAKYSVRPLGGALKAASQSGTYLGDDLAAALTKGEVAYDFQLQFYVDPAKTPIEDASVRWSEADAPPLTVARLTLLQQDPRSETGAKDAAYVDTLSFDPWHALETFRPLGSMMRARSPAYRVSTQQRHAAPEPQSPTF